MTRQVDAKGTIQVTSNIENKIEWTGLWGINLVTTFLSEDATHTTEDGEKTVNMGDTVDVRNGFTGTGTVGTRYESRFNRGLIDLSSEDFTDNTLWDEIGSSTLDTAEEFTRTFTTYLDGNLGLDNNLVDVWGTAASDGQKDAKAGAVSVIVMTHNSEALIKDGAMINQRAADYTTSTAGTTNVAQGETVKVGVDHSGGGALGRGLRGEERPKWADPRRRQCEF